MKEHVINLRMIEFNKSLKIKQSNIEILRPHKFCEESCLNSISPLKFQNHLKNLNIRIDLINKSIWRREFLRLYYSAGEVKECIFIRKLSELYPYIFG